MIMLDKGAGLLSQGMVALDTLGILFGWQMFDHWAHLGGTSFGIWCARSAMHPLLSRTS